MEEAEWAVRMREVGYWETERQLEREAIVRVRQAGLVRRRKGRRGVGDGRRRRRRAYKQRLVQDGWVWLAIQQEVQERFDQVRWEERQAAQWQEVEWGWWLVQRRAVRVGGSRRSAARRGGALWATAVSGVAALRRRGQAGVCAGSEPAGCRWCSTGCVWRRPRRLGGGGKEGGRAGC